MADTPFAGIRSVLRDAAGNAFAAAVDVGALSDETTCESETPTDSKNTMGQVIYAGQFRKGVVAGYDFAQYAAIEALMTNGTKLDLRFNFTNAAGSTESLDVLGILVENLEVVTPTEAGKRNYWRFSYRGYSTTPFKFN